MFYIIMLLLPSAGAGSQQPKCNLFPALRAMETADNVTGKYEDCRDGTKQRTIYVWNIKFFGGGDPRVLLSSAVTLPAPGKVVYLFLFLNVHNRSLCVFCALRLLIYISAVGSARLRNNMHHYRESQKRSKMLGGLPITLRQSHLSSPPRAQLI